MLFVSLLSRGCVRGQFKQWGSDGKVVAVVLCLEKIITTVQTSRYLQPDVKKIGFEV